MFSIKNCAYNLRGNSSRFNQPVSNTTAFKPKSFSYIACQFCSNLPHHVRKASDLKNFFAKLKEINLDSVECRCNLCSS